MNNSTPTDLSDQAIAPEHWERAYKFMASGPSWKSEPLIQEFCNRVERRAREIQALQGQEGAVVCAACLGTGTVTTTDGDELPCYYGCRTPATPSRGDDGWKLLLEAADNIDELANRMPPPNQWTPQFMTLAVSMRALAHNRLSHRGAVDFRIAEDFLHRLESMGVQIEGSGLSPETVCAALNAALGGER